MKFINNLLGHNFIFSNSHMSIAVYTCDICDAEMIINEIDGGCFGMFIKNQPQLIIKTLLTCSECIIKSIIE